jgi:hypothetical protein
MSFHTKIDGLTVCHKGDPVGHVTATLPDVCLPLDRVPVPYGNTARATSLTGGTVTVLVEGGNMAAHSASVLHASTGDEPGVLGGVASGTVAAEASWLSYSNDVFLEGLPACRLTDKMLCNHRNTVAMAGYLTRWLAAWKRAIRGRAGDHDLCKELLDQIDSLLNGEKAAGTTPRPGMRGLVERIRDQIYGRIPPGEAGWYTHEQQIIGLQALLQDLVDAFLEYCNIRDSRFSDLDRWRLANARTWAIRRLPTASDYKGPSGVSTPSTAGRPRHQRPGRGGPRGTVRPVSKPVTNLGGWNAAAASSTAQIRERLKAEIWAASMGRYPDEL